MTYKPYSAQAPPGAISMWHGLIANIPAGWTLCDGTDGTPDLRATFVRGAPDATEAGTTGGEDTHTLTIAEMPSHTHYSKWGASQSGYLDINGYDAGLGAETSATGGGEAHNNMPSYYEILYIMKV